TVRMMVEKVGFHVGNLRRMKWSDWPAYLRSKIRVARNGELSRILKARSSPLARDDGRKGRRSIYELNDYAAAAYCPKPTATRITIFKPMANYSCYPDPQMGWSGLSSAGLEIVELPVNPHAMLAEPYVKQLADALKKRLDAVS